MSMEKIDFRATIRRAMKKRRIQVPELARRTGLNHQTIYNYLAGRSEMTGANLERIFAELGIQALIPKP